MCLHTPAQGPGHPQPLCAAGTWRGLETPHGNRGFDLSMGFFWINPLHLDRTSQNIHLLGCGEPDSGFFTVILKLIFFPLLLIPPTNFLRNSCKIPQGAAHGRGQPFPGQLKYIILITYSKFSCPLVSPHDVRGRRWSDSTHGASPTHGGSN